MGFRQDVYFPYLEMQPRGVFRAVTQEIPSFWEIHRYLRERDQASLGAKDKRQNC